MGSMWLKHRYKESEEEAIVQNYTIRDECFSFFFFPVSALSIVEKTLVTIQRSLHFTGEGAESHGGFLQFTELV